MRAARIFLAGVVLAAAVPASAGERGEIVDLQYTFVDAPQRNQRDIGACHSFVSIALLENAINRRSGLYSGERIRLSEADLFLRFQLKQKDFIPWWDGDFLSSCRLDVNEGASVAQEIRYALENGVALADSVPWDETMAAYRAFRNSMQAQAQQWREENAPSQSVKDLSAFNAQAKGLIQQMRILSASQSERLIPGDSRRLASERERVKSLLKGMAQDSFGSVFFDEKIPADEKCRAKGGPLAEPLMGLLRAHVPVAISFVSDPARMPRWLSGSHAVVLSGFQLQDGRVNFSTRNSWGGDNPPFPDDALCRIYLMNTVMTADEREKAVSRGVIGGASALAADPR